MTELTYGVDTSGWQPKVDGKELKRGGVQFAFAKSSDGYSPVKTFTQQVNEYANAGILVGAYHWLQPFLDLKRQADIVAAQIDGKPVTMVAVDFEQRGTDYKDTAPVKSPQALSDSLQGLLEALRATVHQKLIVYTRATFLIPYALPAFSFLGNYDLWLASYPFHPASRITCSWDVFLSQYAQKAFKPYLSQYWPANDGGASKRVKFWQFTGDRFILPGTYGDTAGKVGSPLDVNMFNGSTEDLRVYLGLQAPRELTLEEKVEVLWQAHPELH